MALPSHWRGAAGIHHVTRKNTKAKNITGATPLAFRKFLRKRVLI
jgi:hypothetical protein